MTRWASLVGAVVSGVAYACPVCGGQGTEQNAGAYLAMTVFLSLLPLSAIGGLAYFLARQMRG